jgi:tetratricopeptide (TPR) repeat protein
MERPIVQRTPSAGVTKKHVILFLAANSPATSQLSLDAEARSIHLELKRSGYRDRFDFVTRWAAEPHDLLRELRELKPTIVHFSGHGHEALRGEPAGLSFHGATGAKQVVTAEAIAQTFGSLGTRVQLVLLNACYSVPVAGALRAHVDCVVGMSGAIHDAAARSFAIGFYGGLGEQESVAAAFQQGRAAINLDGLPDADQPQLQVRDGFDAMQLIPAASPPTAFVCVPCPYPGMRAYSADDIGFYGRAPEINELLGRLRAGERELYVIGPSGSGKSSLVAAGVLPRLARGVPGLGPFVVRTLRPGEHPVARLSEALELSSGQPFVAADLIAALLAHRGRDSSVLLVIDQLEELFTLPSTEEREAFLRALCDLRGERRCAVIATLRADFFGALMESPLWPERRGRDQLSRIEVGPLRGQALRDAIAAPASDAGVVVEPELIERLLADAAAEPGILPLLQETLIQLWDARTDQVLMLADYQSLGDGERSGLAVALARRADATLRRFDATQTDIARRILIRLISFGEGRSDTRRQQPRAKLRAADDDAADFEHVLQAMINDRLLTTDEDDRGGEPLVDLAHEILIVAWPALAGWVQRHRVDEQRRRQLEAVAAQWAERGRGDRGLLDPNEIVDAEAWQQTESAVQLGHSAEVTAFIAASRVAQVRLRRRRRAWIAAGFVVAAGLAVAAFVLTRPPLPTCADEGAAIAQHWNPAIADALRHKLTASGAAYAAQINTSVAAKYTRYAQAWTTTRIAACTARRAGDVGVERTLACLDVRRTTFAAHLATVMQLNQSNGFPKVVPGLADFVLEPVATCEHPNATGAFDDVVRVKKAISTVQDLAMKGERVQGQRQLDELFQQLAPLKYPPIQVMVLIARADLDRFGDNASAEATLRRARELAEVANDDQVKLDVSTRLAIVLATRNQPDQAKEALALADASLARLGGDLGLEAGVSLARGMIASQRHALDDAARFFEHVIDIEEHVLSSGWAGSAAPLLINIYQQLGRAADVQATRARYDKIVPGSLQREATSAAALCSDALKTGDFARAAEECSKDVELQQGARTDRAANAQFGLGLTRWLQAERMRNEKQPADQLRPTWAQAYEHMRIAADLFEHNQVTDRAADAFDNAGYLALQLGDPKAAIDHLHHAITIASALGEASKNDVDDAHADLGRALVAAKRYGEAIAELEAVLPRLANRPKDSKPPLQRTRLSLAEALWQRARGHDRVYARVLVETARDEERKVRATLRPSDPFGAADILGAERLLADIETWLATRK